jgi:hypothetical protein
MEASIVIFIAYYSMESPFGREDNGKGRREIKKKVRRETKGEKERRIEAGVGRDKRRRSGESEFMCGRGGGEIKRGWDG